MQTLRRKKKRHCFLHQAEEKEERGPAARLRKCDPIITAGDAWHYDTSQPEVCMALWDKLKAELIDIIEWLDDSRDTMVWRYPRADNEIKYGAQLIVREG